jgi:hypothetical protein
MISSVKAKRSGRNAIFMVPPALVALWRSQVG